jgi:hypothetical protein
MLVLKIFTKLTYIMKWTNLDEKEDSIMQERVSCSPVISCAVHDRIKLLVLKWGGHQIPNISTRSTYIS